MPCAAESPDKVDELLRGSVGCKRHDEVLSAAGLPLPFSYAPELEIVRRYSAGGLKIPPIS
jgi:hypothetical protein